MKVFEMELTVKMSFVKWTKKGSVKIERIKELKKIYTKV